MYTILTFVCMFTMVTIVAMANIALLYKMLFVSALCMKGSRLW
jgi:hypothetical protein